MAAGQSAPYNGPGKPVGPVSGAFVGITLVLMAVFVPMAFFPGSTGGIYRQFSVTLIVSIGFSALLALTLTPALCATFLKPHVPEDQRKENWLTRRTGRFFTGFNNWFGLTPDRYQGGTRKSVV